MSDTLRKRFAKARPDIQGLVLYPYKQSRFACYQLFEITDLQRFKALLGHQAARGEITSCAWREGLSKDEEEARTSYLNIAFSASGMRALLGRYFKPEAFERPFIEGMSTPARARKLGDLGENAPQNWAWGHEDRFDGVYLAYGASREEAEEKVGFLDSGEGARRAMPPLFGDFSPTSPHTGERLRGKEMFGFRDGISQPMLIGSTRYHDGRTSAEERRLQGVPPGEFVLGFPDGTDPDWEKLSGKEPLPRSPYVESRSDPDAFLPPTDEYPDSCDLGRHGSYLVIRQLAQHYSRFWKTMQAACRPGESAEDLAAKLVGRRMDGTPLAPGAQDSDASFDYADDPRGLDCPIGSHLRRSNPRSSGEKGRNGEAKLRVNNRHRIIRRGRIHIDDAGKPRGLVFACLNASIRRQFEFVQASWCNNGIFGGLRGEVDPMIGPRRPPTALLPDTENFTVPEDPYRRKLEGLPAFSRVKGGAYFFMPGLSALRYLARLPQNRA